MLTRTYKLAAMAVLATASLSASASEWKTETKYDEFIGKNVLTMSLQDGNTVSANVKCSSGAAYVTLDSTIILSRRSKASIEWVSGALRGTVQGSTKGRYFTAGGYGLVDVFKAADSMYKPVKVRFRSDYNGDVKVRQFDTEGFTSAYLEFSKYCGN